MQKTITLTSSAIKHLTESLKLAPNGTIGVRLGLKKYGCSGYAYVFDFSSELKPDDAVIEQNDIKLIISKPYLQNLIGSEIDYVNEGMNQLLKVNNPNTVNACGCGESFQFK